MHICLMHSKELIKGTLRTIVLRLLTERDRMYGYELIQRVRELSDEQLLLTEGALYPTLHKLVSEGLLTTEKEKVNGRTRKYYRLTPSGSSQAVIKVAEFERFVALMGRLLYPQTKTT